MDKVKLFIQIMQLIEAITGLLWVLAPLIITHLYNNNIITFETTVIGILLFIFYTCMVIVYKKERY